MTLRVSGGAEAVQTGCDFLVDRAVMTMHFGPASAQVYPSAQELRDMAAAILAGADEVDSFDYAAWFAADRARMASRVKLT
jgi:hypothetical protein